ncbi:hypothetical protein [Streptomyces chartreusis]|uniref:hypothetical protein n=1 Tax=Streptomyces chartreusis TaxID=1969 RepID=UPI0036660B90
MSPRHIGALTAMLGLLCVPAHADDANGSAGGAATGLRPTAAPSWQTAQFSATLEGAAAPDPLSDISRDTLAPNDGWAADGGGTTGGSTAGCAHVVSGGRGLHHADNSGSQCALTADVGWTPTLHAKIDSAETADRAVARGAGAGRLT